jgi:hypothetical protein
MYIELKHDQFVSHKKVRRMVCFIFKIFQQIKEKIYAQHHYNFPVQRRNINNHCDFLLSAGQV